PIAQCKRQLEPEHLPLRFQAGGSNGAICPPLDLLDKRPVYRLEIFARDTWIGLVTQGDPALVGGLDLVRIAASGLQLAFPAIAVRVVGERGRERTDDQAENDARNHNR